MVHLNFLCWEGPRRRDIPNTQGLSPAPEYPLAKYHPWAIGKFAFRLALCNMNVFSCHLSHRDAASTYHQHDRGIEAGEGTQSALFYRGAVGEHLLICIPLASGATYCCRNGRLGVGITPPCRWIVPASGTSNVELRPLPGSSQGDPSASPL